MSKLHTMEKVVLKVLEEVPATRSDDYLLMFYVCREVCPHILVYTFGKFLTLHKANKFPNWETVTRCRRKIQEKRPDLVSPEKAAIRSAEEEVYIEYARG